MMAVEIERELAKQARERQRLAGKARHQLVQKIAPAETGKARDQAAKLTGTNRQYVTDAKKIVARAAGDKN